MGKKNKQQNRAKKMGKKTVERRNQRHQYSPKPPQQKQKHRRHDGPPTPHEIRRGADALMALLLMGADRSLPWIGREYTKLV
ncbi:MAG TPA: hypothetical protein VHL10_05505 [Nitrososphaera sp.]|nr:hypothetical protein [Nitrososphaera sp.]